MDRLNAFKPTSPRIWTALGLLVLPVLFLSGISFFLLLEKRPRIQAAISTLSFIAYDRDSIDRNLTSLAFFPPAKDLTFSQSRRAFGYLLQIRADALDILSRPGFLSRREELTIREFTGVFDRSGHLPSHAALSAALQKMSFFEKDLDTKELRLTRSLEEVDRSLDRTGAFSGAALILLAGFVFAGIREVRRSFSHLALYEALQRSDSGIAFLDPVSGHFLFANEGFLRLTRQNPGDLATLEPSALFPDLRGIFPGYGEKNPLPSEGLETVLAGKDGLRLPVEMRLERSSFQGRELLLLMVSDRSRKQALEEKNLEILRHLETIVQNLGEGLLEFDVDGRILSANPMAETLLGFTGKEFTGRNVLSQLLGGDREGEARIRMILRQVCSNGSIMEENDLVFRRKDRSSIEVQGVFSPGFSGAPESSSVVLFAFRDAGPRKAMEAELRASEALNRGIVENSPDGIFILNPDRLLVMEGNIRFARMIGLSEVSSLKGLPFLSFSTRPEAEIRKKLSQTRLPGGWEILETSFRRPEGRTIPVSINAVAIPYKGMDAVLVTVRDITFRRQVEQSHILFLELDRLILEGTPPHRLYQTITDRLVSIFPFVHVALFRQGAEGKTVLEAVSSRDPVMQMEIVRECKPFGQFPTQDLGETPFSEVDDLPEPWDRWQKEGRFGSLTRLPFLFTSDRPGGAMEISLEKGETLGDALRTLLEDIRRRLAFFVRHRDELARIRLLEKAFEVTPAPAFISDPEGRIEWANPAYFSLVGEKADSLLQTVHPYLEKREKSRTNTDMWGRLRKGLSANGEFLHRRRKGPEFLAEIRISPILDEDKTLVSLVAIETDITRERRKEKELRLLAFHDPLTGLPNRAALEREFEGYLAVARRYRRILVLLFFDLDGFKEVNDALGHEAGDELLVELAVRLESELRGGDRLFRLGGDEFLVILNNAGTRPEIEQLARRLLEVIHQPFELSNQEVGIGASIGIALYPENAASQQDLLRMADMAMYRAKNRGKNRIEFYDGEEKVNDPYFPDSLGEEPNFPTS